MMKISIIIPIYNTGEYLYQMLNDVYNQTFKDYEVIMIDDGSIDEQTINIETLWTKKDERFKLITKKNEGVSIARNKGLEEATGKYILFLDSDDRIHQKMLEKLYENIVSNKCDISMCKYVSFTKNVNYRLSKTVKRYKREEALESLLNGTIDNFLWNKLFKRELFDDILFPSNKIFEDVYVMHKLLLKAKNICCDQSILYGYYQRNNAYTGTSSKEKNSDYIFAYKNRYEDLKNIVDEKKLNNYYLLSVYNLHLFIAKKHNINLYNDETLLEEYKTFIIKYKYAKGLNFKNKILYLILYTDRKMFFKIINTFYK